jgi:4-amino-4-deoxy-L-arabinose transferase-like glycosyltransferase
LPRRTRPRGWFRAARRRTRSTPVLVVLLVVAGVHGLAWTVASAPLTGPDELAHFAYVQSIAETGHGPAKNDGDGSQSTAVNTLAAQLNLAPILGHPEGRPAWHRAGAVNDAAGRRPHDNTSGPNSAASNPPLYYVLGAGAYLISPARSLLGRIYAVRLLSVLFLVLTVLAAWLVACELFVRPRLRVVATSLVALQPKLGFAGGIVNPDILLALFGTATLVPALRIVRIGLTPGRAAACCAFAGGAYLTHGRGLYLAPVAGLAVAYGLWRARPAREVVIRMGGLAAGILGACGLVALLYTRAHSSGSAFGGQASVASGFHVRQFVSYVWQFYFPRFDFMQPKLGPDYGYRQVFVDTYFGTFGSLEINFKKSVYDGLQILAMLGLVGLYTTTVARWRTVGAHARVVVLCAGTFVAMMVLLHVSSYSTLRSSGDPGMTGRYLLPGVALYAAAAAWVIGSLPRRVGDLLGGALVAGAATLAVSALGITVVRFYG